MKVSIESESGELAKGVVEVVRSVMAAAIADGGDCASIKEDVAFEVGASSFLKSKATTPSEWQMIQDAIKESNTIYKRAMNLCVKHISDVLLNAASEVDIKHYTKQLGKK